jgi:membrane fusion protein, multidrug efflux system
MVKSGQILVFAFLLFAAGCGSPASDKSSARPRTAPAAPVRVVAAVTQEVPLEIGGIGNIEAFSTVQVKSQVAGQLQRVDFQEGQDVAKGAPLFLIDPRIYQQAVQEAEAAVASQRAALEQAEANYQRDLAQAKNARSQANRYANLAAKGVISREQNEQYRTNAEAAERVADATKATISSARAALQGTEAKLADARLQLGFTTIRAPISGRTGSLMVKEGNLVTANAQDPLVVINQITPVFATFSVPEQALSQLRRYSNGRKIPVEARPEQGTGAPVQGILDFVNNEVDTATGTIRLKARFANTDRRLWPGQFVNIGVRLATETATVVPSAAVQTAQAGKYVFVIKPDSTAEQRNVESPRTWGDLALIRSGVNPGERVVVDGQLRVRPGAKVQVLGGDRGQPSSSQTADAQQH